MTRAASLPRRIGLELALWCCAPAAFLLLYVQHHGLSANSVLPHLALILTAWLTAAALRLVVPRIAATILLSVLWLTLVLYYITVLVGLKSWGQIISWDLFASYVSQLPALADALGLPMALVVLAPFLLLLPLAFGIWHALKRYDWIPLLRQRVSVRVRTFMFVGAATIVVCKLLAFAGSGASGDEPIGLTFFPQQNARMLQDHSVDPLGARRLDAIEDAVRSAYTPAVLHQPPPNVVLIVVDALRPDHLGTYGYARDTTPALNRLLQTGQMQAIKGVHATCSESSCGLLSLISSRYIHEFSDRPFTLHEALSRHGYQTHLILGGDHTHFYGLKDAYGKIDSYVDGSAAVPTYYANDDQFVVDRAAALPAWNGRPVSLQFHLMSAHMLGKRPPDAMRYLPSANYVVPSFRKEASRPSFVNYYDNGVFQTDRMIAALLDVLAQKQYLTKALVVITADHGEALGERGEYGHAHTVWEESLRIPLMLVSYGFPLQKMAPRVGVAQVDIAPTILHELGVPLPSSWSGVPLQQPDTRAFTFFQQKQQIGLIDRRNPNQVWKYWADRNAGKEFAYDLSRDPQESSNAVQGAAAGLTREWQATLLKLRPSTTR